MFHFKTLTLRFSHPTLLLAFALTLAPNAFAAKSGAGGSHQLGFSLGITNAAQEHMNTLITRSNTRAGGITTPAMNSGYEAAAHYGYRFSGSMLAVLARPSFFYQVANGTGGGATYNYGVTGFTVFPTLRLYPLENDMMKFFMQFGIGYGRATGSIEESANRIEFVGSAFGTTAGLGAEFCYLGTHCVSIEGNLRYMTAERNVATSVSGPWDASTNSLSQAIQDREVEMDGTDLATRMGGIQLLVGYVFNF